MRTSRLAALCCTIPCAALVVPDRPAPRVDARDHAAIEAALDAGEPFIAAEALNARDCEAWTDALMMQLGDAPVRRQRRGEALEMPLGAFFEDALASSHASPSFLFDEFLLDGDDDLRGAAVGPQRAIFGGERSWFDHFPESRRPRDGCVVGAGAGARSPLHRDPYDWTGTSLCVEGSKVWRFALDVDDADLGAYELASEAFGGDSAGTQSDADLYARRVGDGWPEPYAYDDDPALAATWSAAARFAPDVALPKTARFVTALQRAGDVVVVPPRAWHQTYALEPSLAVASQFCGRRDGPSVVAHVLRHAKGGACRGETDRLAAMAATDAPADVVRALFDAVS